MAPPLCHFEGNALGRPLLVLALYVAVGATAALLFGGRVNRVDRTVGEAATGAAPAV